MQKEKTELYKITLPNNPKVKAFTATKPGKGAGKAAVKFFGDENRLDIKLQDMTRPASGAYTEYLFECKGVKLTVRSELIPA